MADSRLHDQPETAGAAGEDSTTDTPEQMVYRRAPKITPFLVTGGFFGVVIAFFWVAIQGTSEGYTQSQTLGFLAALLGVVGVTVGALVWLMLDRRSKRHMETVYARLTTDPQAADVALTKVDYREWSQLQQRQRVNEERRAQQLEAKAAAKAHKRNKRK